MRRKLAVVSGWLSLAGGLLGLGWGFVNIANEPLWPGVFYSIMALINGYLLLWCASRVCEDLCRCEGN